MEVQSYLANVWFFLIGLMLVLYVVLDGFDLGVGIVSLFVRETDHHAVMMSSIGSVWDANETWLVLLAGALFGAFPLAFGLIFPALYIPLMLMLFGLIFRGVSFEFHEHSRSKHFWSLSFGLGSLTAAVAQGLALGGLLGGVQATGREFTGGVWDWLSPFSVLVAVGVVFGYALLGATWLIIKTTGKLQKDNYRNARLSAYLMLLAAAGVSLWTPIRFDYIAEKWFSLPAFLWIVPLPIFALLSFFMLLRALGKGYEHSPFGWSIAIFLCSFVGLATSFFPYIVPPEVTLAKAASSPMTLAFMLTGIGLLIPVMLVYNGYLYLVFHGKVGQQSGGYGDH